MPTILQPNMTVALLHTAKECLRGEVTAPPRTRALMALNQAAMRPELKPHKSNAMRLIQTVPGPIKDAETCLDDAINLAKLAVK